MSSNRLIFHGFVFVALIAASFWFTPSNSQPALAQRSNQETPTPTQTTQPPDDDFRRPLVVVRGYTASVSDITPGKEFILEVRLVNEGQETATNVVAVFTSGDFIPRETGGVVAVGDLPAGDKHKVEQPLTTGTDIWGKTIATVEMAVRYTDLQGFTYEEAFAITLPIAWNRIVGYATATPTPTMTPTPFLRPQLVITSYSTGEAPLTPGGQFALDLEIQNLGNAQAKQVAMILGGGTAGSDGGSGTPSPGGVSGGSADLANFAPIGTSNIQSLGDVEAGSQINASQALIVNVSTNPGAYALRVTFSYLDDNNNQLTDDQVITLLVFSPPQLELSFYRDPGPLFSGQPNMLPLQVVNLGRKSVILGNMKVNADQAELTNNVILIGPLEAGQYFPLDASIIPFQPGPMELLVTVNFTDDFNQPQQYQQILPVEVMEVPPLEPGGEGFPGGPGEGELPPTQPETFWQKVVRFLRGLFGLDSGQPEPGGPIEGPIEGPLPEGEGIAPGEGIPVP